MTLSNTQYKFLDGVLMNYRHLPSRMARRKLEIETEHSTDINIGASKTNRVIKRTEWLVERFDSDIKLKGLENLKNAIQELEKLLEDKNYSDLLVIYRLRYKEKLMWEEIEDRLTLSRKTVYRRRESILKLFGEFVGVYYDIS
ncbi:TPA: transcriptional regulator [Streptococcus suis]